MEQPPSIPQTCIGRDIQRATALYKVPIDEVRERYKKASDLHGELYDKWMHAWQEEHRLRTELGKVNSELRDLACVINQWHKKHPCEPGVTENGLTSG